MPPYVKQIASQNLLCDAGSSTLALCDSLEGWDAVGGDPMDGSPPGSSVHGIFQAKILE